MFEEVMNVEDANYAVVVSMDKRVVMKIYFCCSSMDIGRMIEWIGRNYKQYLCVGTRLDVCEVRYGRVIGH